MKSLFSPYTSPFFNLALEEYLLKNFDEEYFLMYVNEPSVVVGKHQNALAEVDMEFLEANNIVLARRISGGGAVYHDTGNVNYAFISNEKAGDFVKVEKYTAPIIEALQSLGADASLGKRNEILSGDKKVSGTASHVFKNRVMHHGTLLFDADLTKLSKCLYVNRDRFEDKAVRSVRSEVVNLKEEFDRKMSIQEFNKYVFDFVKSDFASDGDFKLSKTNVAEIYQMVEDKFSTWEWSFGYSPKFSKKVVLDGVEVVLEITKGRISKVLSEDVGLQIKLENALHALLFEKKELEETLRNGGFSYKTSELTI